MIQPIVAVYENGRLRPLKPLNLREHQEVLISVMLVDANEALDHVTAELVAAGALTLPTDDKDEVPLSPEELESLAKRVSAAVQKPLSEMIIEERGEW